MSAQGIEAVRYVFLSSALVQVHQGPELSWYLSGERKIADELCLFIRNIFVIIGVWFDKLLIGQLYFEGPNVGAGRDVLAWSSLFLSHSKINAYRTEICCLGGN